MGNNGIFYIHTFNKLYKHMHRHISMLCSVLKNARQRNSPNLLLLRSSSTLITGLTNSIDDRNLTFIEIKKRKIEKIRNKKSLPALLSTCALDKKKMQRAAWNWINSIKFVCFSYNSCYPKLTFLYLMHGIILCRLYVCNDVLPSIISNAALL